MKRLILIIFLLNSLPAHADDNAFTDAVAAVASAVAQAMDTTDGDDE